MLLTQPMTYTCQCGRAYKGIEGLKYSHRNGEQRTVWKKVKVGKQTIKFGQWDESPGFDCVQCGAKVEV